jgi:hypothetical protein
MVEKVLTEATTETRLKATGSTTFLTSTVITTSVAITLTALTTWTTASTTTSFAVTVTTHHATRRSVRALLLDVCLGNNLGGKVEPFT